MILFCLRRLLALLPIAIGVILIVGLMVHAVPGDPVDAILGEYASLEDKQQLRAQMGLDRPVFSQLTRYFTDVLQADFGNSLISQQPVGAIIAERIRPTLELSIVSIFVAILIAIPLGLLSAVFAGTAIDLGAMFVALLGVSMPNFWLGSMLILFFSLHLDLLPVSGQGDWTTYILPSITMGTALAAALSRMTRNSVLDTLKEDYVRTARAKGNHEYVVIFKHVLRNAALPLVTVIGLQFGVLLMGAVVTEIVFDWKGLGDLLLESVQRRDYPVIQALILLFSGTYLFVNLVTDLVYGVIDPRIKLSDVGD